MKTNNIILLLHGVVIVFFLTGCRKTVNYNRQPVVTITPESREYFGCRINGRSFISEARTNNVKGSCSYVRTYSDNSHTFTIISQKFDSNCGSATITITLDSVQLAAGQAYVLGKKAPRSNYATYQFVPGCNQGAVEVSTSDEFKGMVNISSIDFTKKVIKATFHFSTKDATGKDYSIADGYFDRHF